REYLCRLFALEILNPAKGMKNGNMWLKFKIILDNTFITLTSSTPSQSIALFASVFNYFVNGFVAGNAVLLVLSVYVQYIYRYANIKVFDSMLNITLMTFCNLLVAGAIMILFENLNANVLHLLMDWPSCFFFSTLVKSLPSWFLEILMQGYFFTGVAQEVWGFHLLAYILSCFLYNIGPNFNYYGIIIFYFFR
ncbi:hypothetical protein ACJX0J_012221, partial [Zea mays]